MTVSETLHWWRGVGFGLGLALFALMISLGVVRWNGEVGGNGLLEPLTLIIGMQLIAQGIEYRGLEKNVLGHVCLAIGVVLFCFGILLFWLL